MNTRRVIILEGPDNIGKTTLANQLAKEYYAVVRHWGPPNGDGNKALQSQLNILDDELDNLNSEENYKLEVWDRSVIGESVYGPLYRHYDHGLYWNRLNDLKKHERKIIFIVLYADKEFYEREKIKPKEDEKVNYQTQDEAKKIAVKFVDIAGGLDLKHTLYINCHNYASLDERNAYISRRVNLWLSKKTFEFAKTNDYSRTFFNLNHRLWKTEKGFEDSKYCCKSFNEKDCDIGNDFRKLRVLNGSNVQPIGAVGATKNIKYIFVGESSGYNEHGPQMCHPFYNGASGCLFQSALTSLNIHPIHYYLTNVVKCNPKNNNLGDYVNRATRKELECVDKLYYEINSILIQNPGALLVAFGKVAGEELARLKFNHVICYHPSYYLRMGISHRFAMDLKVVLGGKV